MFNFILEASNLNKTIKLEDSRTLQSIGMKLSFAISTVALTLGYVTNVSAECIHNHYCGSWNGHEAVVSSYDLKLHNVKRIQANRAILVHMLE